MFEGMFENIIYILLALIGLGFLVFIHELGHYFMAKKAKMTVEVFSIGFGKPIYSWKRGDVIWQICALPFGGYVKIAGMEKSGSLEPYQIKDGFFGKRPIERIKVALAGPFANILFAFAAFMLIWFFGGRDKSFGEYTKKIGAVDKSSELFFNGVRPGDEITSYGKRSYNGLNDLLYASVLDGKKCEIKGMKIDYRTGLNSSFEYDLDTYKIQGFYGGNLYSIGVETPASFLMYARSAENDFEVLAKKIGIQEGDRLIWANGEIVFSAKQLSSLINEKAVFLTLERSGQFFHAKIPKVKIEDINLNRFDREEIDDWRYESGIKTKLSNLYFLPYYFNENGVVESRLNFIDENLSNILFKVDERNQFSKSLERGDRIVAVDGIKIESAYDILKLLQDSRVLMIVERESPEMARINWKDADSYFDRTLNANALFNLVDRIGTSAEKKELNNIHLLIIKSPLYK